MRPIRNLTRRQALAISVVVVLGPAIGITALLGLAALTAALVGILVAVVFAMAVQLRRRVAELDTTTRLLVEEMRSLTAAQAHLTDRVEFAQRRIVGAVEHERLAADDRHQDSLTALKDTRQRLLKSGQDQTSEVEALLQLFQDFRPRAPMPSSGHWAVNATGLLELMFLLRTKRPKVVLEFGSGTSSVWMAYAIERFGGRLVSVDHDRAYADRTRWLLNMHDLAGIAEVRLAPLCPLTIGGEGFQWYDAAVFDDVSDVDLLVVDGPPGSVGHDARYPALCVLEHKLSQSATVVLDDADRSDEQDIIRRWLDTVKGLELDNKALGDLAVFTYARPSAVG